VKDLYDKGIRYITLCHSANNAICDSCAPEVKRWGGLSPLGKEVVAEMNRIGMLIDVSHVSDDTFYDVLKYSTKPVVATHSCCRALCDHPRNMTDDMIKALAAAGGVIQINFYPLFLDSGFRKILNESGVSERGELIESEFISDPADPVKRAAWNAVQDEIMALPRPSYRLIADHIDHVVSLVGIDHVGIGSDFDGIEVTPEGMEDVSMMPKLFDELRSRGYSDEDLCKIASGNFFRIMK
jgi:membrane dipeptidase